MDILQIIFLAIILAISIWLHEYAHAASAYYLGDPTPKLQKRLTPNPIAHIDPIGFLMIFVIGFGRGKPVQINPAYFKNSIKGEFFVAMAGPLTNIALAIIGILIMLVYGRIIGLSQAKILLNPENLTLQFRTLFSFLNIALAVFNMIPIPPLDGYRVIKLISPKFGMLLQQYSMYIGIILLIFILGPGRGAIGSFISTSANTIFTYLYTILSYIIY